MKENQSLLQIIEDTAAEMEKLGYSKSSMLHYHEVWNRYLKYTAQKYLNRHDMDEFLSECYEISADTNTSTRYQRSAIRAMNVLAYYAEFGKIYIRFPLATPLNTQTPFDSILAGFTAMLKESGYAVSTIHTHERVITRFLQFLRDDGIKSVQNTSTAHITSFILEITGRRGKVSYELGSLRKFFRYLYKNGLHENNLALFVPASNKLKSRERLPSVWSVDDVQLILQSIDTGNPVGKRDYAMILLATRLGLRGSDIKGLKFHDIDWDKETITVVQAKTKEPVALPLLEDVGMALVDYLRNSRPVSDHPYVFLALRAPYNPLSRDNHLHQVLNKYINCSGVTITADKSHGMHSMRHTLASKLLKQGTPLPIISGILGHRDSNTTAEYLRVGVEQLRSCTLDLEVLPR
ncbi:site-specific integrase [Lederbergia sp. NSJ-179]|uniref:site-specific integrase n=1 Tax=Lederbergia sp. NSJ-179 TaxID=2931402 RepID=UPI001FD2F5D5|nr:site-specific integrase [Lederbergia sp. NSJ-179]MCJ7842123.1 site-specific integrase [Lederbergia sp. NSJ-179]